MVFLQQILKGMLAFSVGLFGLLVAVDNILDYDTNWQFVRHVLSMDSMEPWFAGNHIRSRAITSPLVQHVGYIAIITGEFVTGVLCTIGGISMLYGALNSAQKAVIAGKKMFIAGCIPAVMVWYTGFAVIGGEYLAMWANQWDGQTKAYTFVTFILLALVYITRPECE